MESTSLMDRQIEEDTVLKLLLPSDTADVANVLTKVEDLVTRLTLIADIDPGYLQRLSNVVRRNKLVTLRQANLANLENEIDILVKITARRVDKTGVP